MRFNIQYILTSSLKLKIFTIGWTLIVKLFVVNWSVWGFRALNAKSWCYFLPDIVSYSKMMAQDEAGTLARLRSFSKNVNMPNLD